jgi:hypothetical protein
MVTTDQGALTVADLELCTSSNNLNDDDKSHHTDEIGDDHNSIGEYVNDDNDEDDDDDSFLANNSICKMHKSTIRMLDSLTDEMVEMARSDTTDNKTLKRRRNSNQNNDYLVSDMTIDLNTNNTNDNDESLMHSPLNSPMNIRNILSITKIDNTTISIPRQQSFNNSKNNYDDNDDDSTLCSIDNSINNELNALKDVAKELGKELEAENLNIHTVFEAIERIGNSDDPNVKNILVSDERDIIRTCIRDEIRKNNNNKQQQKMKNIILRYCHLGYSYDHQMFDEENTTKSSVIILIVSILIGLILKYISST